MTSKLDEPVIYPKSSHHHMQNVNVTVNTVMDAVKQGAELAKNTMDVLDNGIDTIKKAQIEYMKSFGTNERNYKKPDEIIEMLKEASKSGIPYVTIKSDELKPKTIEYLLSKGARFMEADAEDIIKAYGKEKSSCFCPDTKLSGINAVNITFSLI